MLMMLPVTSQTTLRGEIKSIINQKGDTLITMSLHDAKIILTDLLECEITDSLLKEYIERDSLNNQKIILKDKIISNLELQNLNKNQIIQNINSIIQNKDSEISLKNGIIKVQEKQIKKQKRLKVLGFVGSIALPILTLIALL